jgi:hypothetical protein
MSSGKPFVNHLTTIAYPGPTLSILATYFVKWCKTVHQPAYLLKEVRNVKTTH